LYCQKLECADGVREVVEQRLGRDRPYSMSLNAPLKSRHRRLAQPAALPPVAQEIAGGLVFDQHDPSLATKPRLQQLPRT
jgi:hypothetical protein